MTTTAIPTDALHGIGGINYAAYLPGSVWPSDSKRTEHGHPAIVEVATMAPQYAASALAQLVRWAVHSPAGLVLEIDDVTAREEFVRRSHLGLALAARAQSLSLDDAGALFAEAPVPVEVLVAELLSTLSTTLALPVGDLVDPVVAVVASFERRHWKVRQP